MALVSFTFHLMYNLIAAEHGQEVTTKQKVRNYVSMGVYILVAVLAGFCPIAAYIAVAVVTIWGIIPQKKEKSKSV
jgi:hypothetical protein